MTSVIGHTFNISIVNREHMGEYICVADNGIPPRALKRIKLQVKCKYFDIHIYIYVYILFISFIKKVSFFAVPPFIRIRNQMIRARSQSTVVLECEVEAFPEPIVYWEREDRRLKMSEKYRLEVYDRRDMYKVKDNSILSNVFIYFCVMCEMCIFPYTSILM